MKTVATINPELEYDNAKTIIDLAAKELLSSESVCSLNSSVDNLITTARVLIEREERRRGKPCPKKTPKKKGRKKGSKRSDSKKLPSERYPALEVIEEVVHPEETPSCPCCSETMNESGLFAISESLEVIPKSYFIKRSKRVIFNCGKCYGAMVNTPAAPSIVPSSNYGDSLIIDVSLSKFCDLLPMERYSAIAGRSELQNLPPHSLIGLTHQLAYFMAPVLEKIKKEVQVASELLADETPHKMLEGDDTRNWYLWGFFWRQGCYFEAHNTRATSVIKDFLIDSRCKYLVSDGYAAYSKAVREVNEELDLTIKLILCNAHAYRYFKDAAITWEKETEVFLELYGEIYELERQRKANVDTLSFEEQLKIRQDMEPLFKKIKKECGKALNGVMAKSALEKSINYFLNHYEGLTLCVTDPVIPLDNNLSERNLRSPVVGRKTWYGTHSKKGAYTNAALFSIVQSCKICEVNPRNYFPWVVDRIHNGLEVLTPFEYSNI